MQKFILLLVLVAAAIFAVEGHTKLNFPMSRVEYTAAEIQARQYKQALASPVNRDLAARCGDGAENVRGPVGTTLTSNAPEEVRSTIAVNHGGRVYYGLRVYAAATGQQVSANYEEAAWQSIATAGLGVLIYKDENDNDTLKTTLVFPPQFACTNCALTSIYYNTATPGDATTMWNSCSDIIIQPPTYDLRAGETETGQPAVVTPTGLTFTGTRYLSIATPLNSGENIRQVNYLVDEELAGVADAFPFKLTLDSAAYANGVHTLTATVIHTVATTVENLSTDVSVSAQITFSNTCPDPQVKQCANGETVTRGAVPGCLYDECSNPTCLNGNLGNRYQCSGQSTEKVNFNSIACGPLCDDTYCCDPPADSCGAYTCSGQGMYKKPWHNVGTERVQPSNVACRIDPTITGSAVPVCSDQLCCAPPGACTDEVCQIAAQTMTAEAGMPRYQTLREVKRDVLCGAVLCEPNDCCAVPASCGDFTCEGPKLVQAAGLYLPCKGERCTKEECCEPMFTCSQFDCPANQHHVDDAESRRCSAVSCAEPGLCCEVNQKCSTFDCSKFGLAPPPNQADILCERVFGPDGFGEVTCSSVECCMNTVGAGKEGGLFDSSSGNESTHIIAGVLLGVLIFVVGSFLVWKAKADKSRGDHTRNMLDGAKMNAVNMRAPPSSAAPTYNGGQSYGNNGGVSSGYV